MGNQTIILYEKDKKQKHMVLSILKAIPTLTLRTVQSFEQLCEYINSTNVQGIVYDCDTFSKLEHREIGNIKRFHLPLLIIATYVESAYPHDIIIKPLYTSVAFSAQLQINIKLMQEKKETDIVSPTTQGIPSTRLIGIGASTGGPRALSTILKELPVNMCGIIIVQHMTQSNTSSFIQYLHNMCKLTVKEAQEGEVIRNGIVYIAKQKQHLVVKKKHDGFYLHYQTGEKVNCVCPSIDVLFHSISIEAKFHAAGVLLTGMGCDGAQGLLEMKQAGAFTIIQNEETCELYSMPKEAKKLNAHQKEAALQDICACLIERYKCL